MKVFLITMLLLTAPATRSDWIALAKGGFIVPSGRTAAEMLTEMNQLLGSNDPVLRDEVAYSAAERWILRDHRLSPPELRSLLRLWTTNLDDGLGIAGDDRVFKRSFSALSLSLIAAADLSTPFLEPAETQAFFDRMLDYFQRERDLRGFDPVHGWMHTVAHTSDALKFLARNPKLSAGSDARLLAAVRAKIDSHDAVFTWGENDRMALALQSVLRRPDADASVLRAWTQEWAAAHAALWANGPQIDRRRFARVENAAQVMRSLYAALAMEAAPTPSGEAARAILLAALATMR
ncbi:MAG TPA: DUF2785 domain-containing protein [Vicinamibacterales bacterium]|nr:DUF2785 domain-containing protein [Vicinamibacterales bacterium]